MSINLLTLESKMDSYLRRNARCRGTMYRARNEAGRIVQYAPTRNNLKSSRTGVSPVYENVEARFIEPAYSLCHSRESGNPVIY